MAEAITNTKDIKFLLHDVFNLSSLCEKYEEFSAFNKKTINMIVSEASNFAMKELLPINSEGDKGCTFDKGRVLVPESFKRAFDLYCQGDWLATSDEPEFGGQGMPIMLTVAAQEMFTGANMAFLMYPGLTHGAARMIHELGNDEQRKTYVPNMYKGKWAGTMLLTEPEAGTDVGALSTTARRNTDGTYSISGSKIFISGGEQNLTENIIHAVLARVEGAPNGTAGVSLFIVPKYKVNEDGSLGDFNNVTCTGIEEKMGIHGNATCSLSLEGATGYLLGEENKGLKGMFLMMNEARFACGIQALGQCATSYANAVKYAKERVQSPTLLDMLNPEAKSVSIVQHPDVRRQLLSMKSYVEGIRGLIYYAANCFQMAELEGVDEADREKYNGLCELLTPVIKAYSTDKSFEVCVQGLQVFGGYGYINEYPQEQLLRDCKITSVYEGTNGVQAMDLLGRKLGMKKGKPFMDLLGEISGTISMAKGIKGLERLASELEKASSALGETAMVIGATAMSDKILNAFGSAVNFLEVTGDVTMGWIHLMRAVKAAEKLENEKVKKKDLAFYHGQIETAKFFMETMIPTAIGKMNSVKNSTSAVMDMPEDAFI